MSDVSFSFGTPPSDFSSPVNPPVYSSIGFFQIGISPIGGYVPYTWDFTTTFISEYANSPILTSLIGLYQQWFAGNGLFEEFFTQIWYLSPSMSTYGLDIWGEIVGLSGRTVSIPSGTFLGFEEQGPFGIDTFGNASFGGDITSTTNYELSNQAYYNMIQAKALANICDGSIPAINQVLMTLFPNRGNAYVTEPGNGPTTEMLFEETGEGTPFGTAVFATGGQVLGGPFVGFQEAGTQGYNTFGSATFFAGPTEVSPFNMTMTYTFDFPLLSWEYSIVIQSNILPKPAGVLATVVLAGQGQGVV